MKLNVDRVHFLGAGGLVLALVLGLAAGCKNQPAARTDQQISSDIQAKINGEGALAQQSIQVSVANGVATLTGTVTDEASRALAGNDSGTIAGVKTVVNNLTVQAAQSSPPATAQPLPQASQPEPVPARRSERDKRHRDREKDEQPAPAPPQQVAEVAPPPPPPAQETPTPPPPPPAPPKPVIKLITLDAGTVVPVRITETLDSKTAQPNDVFHGSVAGDLGSQGVIVIPRGAPVMGRIVDAREAAHFKGNSMLSLELTELTARGQNVTLVTDTYSKEGEGRGKNTAEKVGGGAALGSIIGALAGGGKGAVIGGLAGGAAGTGVNAATRGQQTVIPTETLINFRLQSPITVKVTIPPSGADEDNEVKDPQLKPR
jgi:hypothetical protein